MLEKKTIVRKMQIRQGLFSLTLSPFPLSLSRRSPRDILGTLSTMVLFHWMTFSHLINHLS